MDNLEAQLELKCLELIEQIVLDAPQGNIAHIAEEQTRFAFDQGVTIPLIYREMFQALESYSLGLHSHFIKSVVPIYHKAKVEKRLPLVHLCEYRLGSTMYRLGRNSEAINYLTKALDSKSLGLYRLAAHASNYLGIIQFNLGHFEQSLELIEQGVFDPNIDESFTVTSPLLSNYANLLAELGRFEESEQQFLRMTALIDQLDENKQKANYYYYCSYAGYLECKEEFVDASLWYEKAYRISLECNDVYLQLEDLLELCECARRGGRYSRVEQFLLLSMKLLNQIDTCALFDSFAELSLYLSELDHYPVERQIQFAKQAANLFKRSRDLAVEQESKLISEVYEMQLKEAQFANAQSIEKNLSLLSAIGSYLTTSESLDAVAVRLHEDLAQFMKLDLFGIALYNAERNTLTFEHYYEDGTSYNGFVVNCDNTDSLSAYVLKSKKFYVENDFSREEQSRVLGLQLENLKTIGHDLEFSASVMFAPIIFDDEVLGVLTVQSKSRFSYSSYHVRILEQLVNYLAMGLMNIHRHSALLTQKAKFKQLSVTDQLTGLFNRQGLSEFVEHATTFYRSDQQVGVALMDVDHFKQYNDHYGHLAGDKLLVQISERLNQYLTQSTDAAFRFGGDEFMLVVPDTSKEQLAAIITNITEHLQRDGLVHATSPIASQVTLSVGAVIRPVDALLTLDAVIYSADKALYQAKANGRNQVQFDV